MVATMTAQVPSKSNEGMQQKPRVVFLWAWPRTTSTMLERAFMGSKDFVVEHEPTGLPFYWSKEKVSPRFSDEECAKGWPHLYEETYSKVWDRIMSPRYDEQGNELRVFVKDMAKFVMIPKKQSNCGPPLPSFEKDGNPTVIPTEKLLDPAIQHCFLIRDPEKSGPSWYKLVQPGSPTGFEGFNPEELGVEHVKTLYDFINKNRAPQSPDLLVVDSADLVANPEGMVRRMCESIGAHFDPEMLQWKPGSQKSFDAWPGWHLDAEHSTSVRNASDKKPEFVWPDELRQAVDERKPVYEYMRAKKTVLQ